MHGITISDTDERDVLAFDLADILRLLGAEATSSRWRLAGVEAMGGCAADELHRLSEAGTPIEGRRLLELASQVSQVIDGSFEAFRAAEESPWLVIEADDSSYYHVQTTDEHILQPLRASFHQVREFVT